MINLNGMLVVGGLLAALGTAGCRRDALMHNITIKQGTCENVPDCGDVCYKRLENGEPHIEIDGIKLTGHELEWVCRLDAQFEFDGFSYDALRIRYRIGGN